MLLRLFPRVIDNRYYGAKAALWMLAAISLSKAIMGVNCAGLNPWLSSRWVIENADGIPLANFPDEAVRVIVFLFSAWGLALLVLSLIAVLALVRYRAMVPLVYLLLGLEQIGRKSISLVIRPIDDTGLTPGFFLNWGFSALLLIGLALALIPSRRRSAEQT